MINITKMTLIALNNGHQDSYIHALMFDFNSDEYKYYFSIL